MKNQLVITLLFAAATSACIHKQAGPVSAWERVNINMAALAQLNNSVARGVISLQQTGVVTVEQAAPILNFQENVAKDHAAIENIFSAGAPQTSNQAAVIQALLEEIKNQGNALILSGGLGVKNPNSQQTFTKDLQAIVNLAEIILTNYQQAKAN